jgi:hypothetical protein
VKNPHKVHSYYGDVVVVVVVDIAKEPQFGSSVDNPTYSVGPSVSIYCCPIYKGTDEGAPVPVKGLMASFISERIISNESNGVAFITGRNSPL